LAAYWKAPFARQAYFGQNSMFILGYISVPRVCYLRPGTRSRADQYVAAPALGAGVALLCSSRGCCGPGIGSRGRCLQSAANNSSSKTATHAAPATVRSSTGSLSKLASHNTSTARHSSVTQPGERQAATASSASYTTGNTAQQQRERVRGD